jgi:hypothetical protein
MCQFPRLLVHAAHHEVRKVLGATSWVGKKPSTREDLLDIALVREVARSPTKDGVVQRKPLPHVPHERKLIEHATFEHELLVSWPWKYDSTLLPQA